MPIDSPPFSRGEERGSLGAARPLAVRRLGLVPYADGLELQRALVDDRKADRIPDTLLLLQHPHVVTVGVKKDGRSHIIATPQQLEERGVDVFETGRGGDVTYHGPGQIVGYPIIDLNPDRRDVHRYVRDLEEVMIRVCADYGVIAGRSKGFSGAWVRSTRSPLGGAQGGPEPAERSGHAAEAKIGAIGVRISRWITSHGFAFNVATDVEFFNLIVPCGISDRGVTSLSQELGRPVAIDEVEERFIDQFASVFERNVTPASLSRT
jgi:lipoyl(octanoyl) transferase